LLCSSPIYAATEKTQELAANPRCELCYLDEAHDQVRITGTAEVLTDRALLDEIWESNPLLRRYLGTPDNPELIIYRIRPEQVRFMREWAWITTRSHRFNRHKIADVGKMGRRGKGRALMHLRQYSSGLRACVSYRRRCPSNL
jgi:hypothetical protein